MALFLQCHLNLRSLQQTILLEINFIMSEENNTGNNLIWAIATIIIVAIIAGALYFTVLQGNKTQNKTINVEIPK